MLTEGKIWVGTNENGEKICLLPSLANRHGLIAGATGTGKTITLKVLAESFSDLGVPVFLADVKGDLAGIGVKITEKHADQRCFSNPVGADDGNVLAGTDVKI